MSEMETKNMYITIHRGKERNEEIYQAIFELCEKRQKEKKKRKKKMILKMKEKYKEREREKNKKRERDTKRRRGDKESNLR